MTATLERRRPPRIPFLAAASLVLGLVGGCGDEVDPRELLAAQRFDSAIFQDLPLPDLGFGGVADPPGGPARVISLISSVTELVYALGVEERLIARSDWCDFPPECRRLPSLGRQESFRKEAIADLRPDLVVVFRVQGDLARGLREDFRLNVVTPGTESSAEIFDGIAEVAAALGVPERGARLIAHVQDDLDLMRRERAGGRHPSVLLVLDREPLFVAGARSFVGELIRAAGGRNAADGDGAWIGATVEQVLHWDPEVIIDVGVGDNLERDLRVAAEFWARLPSLRAVRDHRVALLRTGVITRPGPRMAAAARKLADVIHGL